MDYCTRGGCKTYAYTCIYKEYKLTYTHNIFTSLGPDVTSHVYSAVYKGSKAVSQASHERCPTSKQVVAIYDVATAVEQEDSAI